MSKKYTDAQKAAYWKRKASASARPAKVRGYGAYKPAKGQVYYKRYRAAKKAAAENSSNWLAPPDSIGGTIGGWLGHGAQKVIKAITGFGDYNIEANSLVGASSPPEIVNSSHAGGVILRHREFIGDVLATEAFTTESYDINPGLVGSFPWLSQIASSYELYRMRGLVYEFKSMASDAVLSTATSSALGTVVMATQYNSLNSPFTSKIQMENHEFANSNKPSCSFFHPVECKRSLIPTSELYTRDGSVPDNADQRLYDLGKFTIATVGQQAASGVIGELWATYEVELYQQKYSSPFTIRSAHVRNATCTAAAWLGAAHDFVQGSSLDISLTSNVISFPTSVKDGTYLLVLSYVAAGGAAQFVHPSLLQGPDSSYGDFLIAWNNASQGFASAPTDGVLTSAKYMYAVLFKVLKPGLTLTFSGGTMSASEGDLWITQVDGDIMS